MDCTDAPDPTDSWMPQIARRTMTRESNPKTGPIDSPKLEKSLKSYKIAENLYKLMVFSDSGLFLNVV